MSAALPENPMDYSVFHKFFLPFAKASGCQKSVSGGTVAITRICVNMRSFQMRLNDQLPITEENILEYYSTEASVPPRSDQEPEDKETVSATFPCASPTPPPHLLPPVFCPGEIIFVGPGLTTHITLVTDKRPCFLVSNQSSKGEPQQQTGGKIG